MNRYEEAKKIYAELGVDTDKAIETLKKIPVALHCWQGDDVRGFDQKVDALSGGIQTTGNYPGRARTPEELMADIDMVLKLCPGTKKLNLHACYAIFDEENGGCQGRRGHGHGCEAPEQGSGLIFLLFLGLVHGSSLDQKCAGCRTLSTVYHKILRSPRA